MGSFDKIRAWSESPQGVQIRDKLNVFGQGLMALSNGQTPDVAGAWGAIQDRRAQQNFSKSLQDPSALTGFTPEQKAMLARMPPEMAQALIMERMFAQPDPLAELQRQKLEMEIQQMQNPQQQLPADVLERQMLAEQGGLQPGTPEYQNYMLTGQTAPPAPDLPASVDEYQYYANEAMKAGQAPMSYADWTMRKAQAGATNVNVGGGSDKQVFDAMMASAETAKSAATGLAGLYEAQKAVEDGIISGLGADQRLWLQKAGAALGVADPAVIENTETFRAAIAPQVAAMIKATVGSANISNADREFAEKAAGGNITLDAVSIKRLMGVMRKMSEAGIKAHMDRLNSVYPEGRGFDRERALFGVAMPEMAAPVDAVPDWAASAGFTQEQWNSLTPEQKAELAQ